jgi:hypothetical protein
MWTAWQCFVMLSETGDSSNVMRSVLIILGIIGVAAVIHPAAVENKEG